MFFSLPSLALAVEEQPRQAWAERTAQEYPPAHDFKRKRHRGAISSPQKLNGNEASLVPVRGPN
jgi:hypothetical protein